MYEADPTLLQDCNGSIPPVAKRAKRGSLRFTANPLEEFNQRMSDLDVFREKWKQDISVKNNEPRPEVQTTQKRATANQRRQDVVVKTMENITVDASPSFLGIPAELRNQICECCLVFLFVPLRRSFFAD
jgi:hypothetical protein